MARTDPQARYRNAWQAGSSGRPLPPRLADLADSDPNIDQAYDAGQNQVSFQKFLDAVGLSAPKPGRGAPFSTGLSAGQQSAQTARSGRQTAAGRVAGSAAGNLGSVLLGFVAAALFLSVLDYGAKGPLYWFEAKFLNDAAPGTGPKVSATISNAVTG